MSYTTITQSTQDQALIDRVTASVQKEAHSNPEFADTNFGASARMDPYWGAQQMIWPVAIDYEQEYSYAIDQGNPNPGGDVGVITDANIQAAVQTNWPPDQPLPPV